MAERNYAAKSKTILANDYATLAVNGATYFKCLSSTADFLAGANDDAPSNFRGGRKITARVGTSFDLIRIENPNNFPVTIEYAFGTGDVEDDTTYVDGQTVTGSGENIITLDPVTVTSSVAVDLTGGVENVTRSWISPEGGDIRIGASNITTSKGQKVSDGSTALTETNGAMHAIATGSNVTVQVMCEVQ